MYFIFYKSSRQVNYTQVHSLSHKTHCCECEIGEECEAGIPYLLHLQVVIDWMFGGRQSIPLNHTHYYRHQGKLELALSFFMEVIYPPDDQKRIACLLYHQKCTFPCGVLDWMLDPRLIKMGPGNGRKIKETLPAFHFTLPFPVEIFTAQA